VTDNSDGNPDGIAERRTIADHWLKREARRIQGRLLQVIGLAVVGALLIIVQARLLADACQRVVIEGSNADAVMGLAVLLALLAALRGGLVYWSERRTAAALAGIKERVRSRLYRRMLETGPSGSAGEGAAPQAELATTGIDGLEPYFGRFLPHLIQAALLPLLFLAAIFPSEWRSGLVLLFSAPFIPLFMILIGQGAENLNRKQWGHLSRMAAHLLDLIQGLPDLKIFGAVKREAAMVSRISQEYRQATMTVLRVAFLSAFALEFFATVGTAVVAVIVGFRLLSGGMPLYDGLFVLLIAPEFYLPLRTLGLSFHARMNGIAAAERIAPLLSLPASTDPGTLPAPEDAPHISLDDVTFRYGGERGGVLNLTLDFEPGTMTVLAGESGAGKSTLARLLTGLARPESGRILVNGRELSAFDPSAWRDRMAWVPQRPYFTAGTIRENLLLGRPDASETDIAAALAAASAESFIARLPNGLETLLGDRGAGLSGGELRRLALARALIRRAVLVVLDEPTAGLDRENELLVGEALRKLVPGRTVLVISHRDELLAGADRVVELAGGTLARIVTHVMAASGTEALP
jgi:ATP-binding cassette, subfamily C, bacterial CydD